MSQRIILIEDNDADVLLVRKALAIAGVAASVERFEGGGEAMEALCSEEGIPVPDAILLDLNTPGCHGFETLKTFQGASRLAGVPIAILTSSKADRDRRKAAEHGVRFLTKPSQLDEFMALIGGAVKEMLAAVPVPAQHHSAQTRG